MEIDAYFPYHCFDHKGHWTLNFAVWYPVNIEDMICVYALHLASMFLFSYQKVLDTLCFGSISTALSSPVY